MSKREGDFSQGTRNLLARRAGYRCSFPACGAPTAGPSAESEVSTADTGMACHIVAASDGPQARRVEPAWGAEQLSDSSNGIWMCYTHGKLIDTDEETYTVEVLRTWRKLAELRARLSQETGRDIKLTPTLLAQQSMPEYCADVTDMGSGLKVIVAAIEASCMPQIWGLGISRALRDVLIEVSQNAFTHGKAKSVRLKILPNSIQLIDDGTIFNPLELSGSNGRGGGLAVEILFRDFGSSLYHSHRASDGKNVLELSFVRSQDEIRALTTCAVDVGHELLWNQRLSLELPAECRRVYLMFPPHFALSWSRRVPELLANSVKDDQEVVLVGEGLSNGVVETLRRLIPDIMVINFERSGE